VERFLSKNNFLPSFCFGVRRFLATDKYVIFGPGFLDLPPKAELTAAINTRKILK
jgi:hypothetical protein